MKMGPKPKPTPTLTQMEEVIRRHENDDETLRDIARSYDVLDLPSNFIFAVVTHPRGQHASGALIGGRGSCSAAAMMKGDEMKDILTVIAATIPLMSTAHAEAEVVTLRCDYTYSERVFNGASIFSDSHACWDEQRSKQYFVSIDFEKNAVKWGDYPWRANGDTTSLDGKMWRYKVNITKDHVAVSRDLISGDGHVDNWDIDRNTGVDRVSRSTCVKKSGF